MVLCAWSPGGGLPSSLLCSVNLHYGWGNETQLIQYPSKYSLYYFWVFETNIFHYDRILDYFSWFSTILGDWNQCISLHLPRFCCFTPWMVLRKKKSFPRSWGYPQSSSGPSYGWPWLWLSIEATVVTTGDPPWLKNPPYHHSSPFFTSINHDFLH